MKFNHRTGPNPSQASAQPHSEQRPSNQRRRGRRNVAFGVGIGLILVAVLALLTGAGPVGLLDTDSEVRAEAGDIGVLAAECEPVTNIDENPDCRYAALVESIQQFWTDEFARRGASYEPAATTFFSSSVRTACGATSDQVGPFYCPADAGVYLDLDFFDVLRTHSAAGSAAFGDAYVLAHEYGHHIQNLTGQMWDLRPGSGAASDVIRLELQADCYAGVWAHHATRPSPSGETLITDLSDQDVADGLAAAETAGDDYVEGRFQGTVAPELWAHGSIAQRLRWFEIGFAGGALEDCDTFSTTIL